MGGVFLNGYRPRVSSIPSKTIRDLISNCWDTNSKKRPSMKTVVTVLRVELAALLLTNSNTGGGGNGSRRRHKEDLLPNGYDDDNSVVSFMKPSSSMANTSALSLRGFGSVSSLVDSITSSLSLRDFPKCRNSPSSSSILTSIPVTRSTNNFSGIKSFTNKTCNKMRRRSSDKNFVWNQHHHQKESTPNGQQEKEEVEEEKTAGSDS